MEQYLKFWERAVKEVEKLKAESLTGSYDERPFRPVSELNTIDWDMEILECFKMLAIDYLKTKNDFDLEKDIRKVISVSFAIGNASKHIWGS